MRLEFVCILLLAVVASVHAQADVAPKEQGDARSWFTTFTLILSTTTSTTTITSVSTCTTTTAALTTCSAGRRRRGLFYDEYENQGRVRRGLFYNEEDDISLPVKRWIISVYLLGSLWLRFIANLSFIQVRWARRRSRSRQAHRRLKQFDSLDHPVWFFPSRRFLWNSPFRFGFWYHHPDLHNDFHVDLHLDGYVRQHHRILRLLIGLSFLSL